MRKLRKSQLAVWMAWVFTAVSSADQASMVDLKTEAQKQNYSAGMDMGRQVHSVLNSQGVKIENEPFLAGMVDGFTQAKPRLTEEELKTQLNAFAKHQMDSQALEFKNAVFKNEKELTLLNGQPVEGSKAPDVRIVEFFDYNCPHCKKLAVVLEQLVEKDSGVQLVYREFPILGQGSLNASKAALSAARQGKYLDLHQAFLKSTEPLDEAQINQIAEKIGLDLKQFKKDMADPTVIMAIRDNHQLAEKIQLTVSPAIFVAKVGQEPDGSDPKKTKEKVGSVSFRTGEVSESDLSDLIKQIRGDQDPHATPGVPK